jgi:DNA-binding CsgD family transcriptional regulator
MADPRVGVDMVRALADRGSDVTSYREAVLGVLRRRIGFDHHVWVLTDPVTGVGAAPHAILPDGADLAAVVGARYLTSVLRWTNLDGTARLGANVAREGGWHAALSRLGVTDVLTSVHRDERGCWSFLDLWRTTGSFTRDDQALLDGVRTEVTRRLRRLQGDALRLVPPQGVVEGSGVIVLDDELRIIGDTARASAWLTRLLPPAHGQAPVPAVVLNAAAQLVAVERGVDDHEPMTRVHVGRGVWLTARAERLAGGTEPRLAVTLTPSTSAERLEVHARAFGLSSREGDVVRLLAEGCSTSDVARTLHLSEYTVQDHLKSVFDKTGTRARGALVAQACGRV